MKASKLTARGLAYVVRAVGRKIAKAHRAKQTPHGKQTVKKLMAHGTSTSSLELSGDTKLFDRVARKWNVDYTQATVEDKIYKVSERITSLSYEVHMKYNSEKWLVAAKSVLGSNLTQTSMLGGYGIKSIDPRTGEQEYSPNRNSSSWINIVYGKTWKPAIFFGYMKNLGTSDAVTNMYGTGTNVDQLLSGTAELQPSAFAHLIIEMDNY